MIMRCGRCLGPEKAAEIASWARGQRITLLADSSDISSFVHLTHVEDWCEQIDALLLGGWISAGLPIAALMVKQSFLRAVNGTDSPYRVAAFLNGAETPPGYKFRVVQRCVANFRRSGYLQALLAKHARFFDELDTTVFEKVDGLLYMKNSTVAQGAYGRLRLHGLKEGFLLPRRSTWPLSISYAHSDELLARSARGLNALLKASNRLET